MEHHYTNERNVQIVIALMKAHGLKRVIVSPGATNVTFVGSIQNDPYFEIYSSGSDERSAAYMACGLAAETGEPVAISCTGATASRNYMPGLTEAFYRKLPVLAITSTQHTGRIGNLIPQVIDRSVTPNDLVKVSVQMPTIHCEEDEWACNVAANRAMLALRANGGGPAHINLETTYSKDFSVREIAPVRVIRRYEYGDELPALPTGRLAVLVGSHQAWSDELTQAVDSFCECNNAVVLCEHASKYYGRYRVNVGLLGSQQNAAFSDLRPNVVIHLGEVAGDDGTINFVNGAYAWRVSPDGEIRDTYKKLMRVFAMHEVDFFRHYSNGEKKPMDFFRQFKEKTEEVRAGLPELPFSNAWIASQSVALVPEHAVLHLAILNTIRTWGLFDFKNQVEVYANTGGFGIDGCVSTLLGASLTDPNRLHFIVVGDLAFFYDMNVLGNRHLGRNVRILLVNNGRGQEFRNFHHLANRFGNDADKFMAAAGHYGSQSPDLVKHYVSDLGFEYLSADTKEDYITQSKRFFMPELTDRPMLLEVFPSGPAETQAIESAFTYEHDIGGMVKNAVKSAAMGIAGQPGVDFLKKCKHSLLG